jgi:hypothetical protein
MLPQKIEKALKVEHEMWNFIKEKLSSVGVTLTRTDGRWYYAKLDNGPEHNFTPELFLELWVIHKEEVASSFVEVLMELDGRGEV